MAATLFSKSDSFYIISFMKQYLVIAHDGNDGEALARRMEWRPKHFERARALKATGNFVIGGAILNEDQQMTGSMMVVQFQRAEVLQEWLKDEPYVVGEVWKTIEVKPFKVAEL